MGRMKELFIDQNEMLDADFQYEEFLAKQKLSNCCCADMSRLTSEDDPSFLDLQICPDCYEHCSTL